MAAILPRPQCVNAISDGSPVNFSLEKTNRSREISYLPYHSTTAETFWEISQGTEEMAYKMLQSVLYLLLRSAVRGKGTYIHINDQGPFSVCYAE